MAKKGRTREELDAWKGEAIIEVAANRCTVCGKLKPRREVDVRFDRKIVVCNECERLESTLTQCVQKAKLFRHWLGTDERAKSVAIALEMGGHLDALADAFRRIGRPGFAKVKEMARESLLTHEMGARVASYVERILFEASRQFPEFDAEKADATAVSFLDEEFPPEDILAREERRLSGRIGALLECDGDE